MPLKQRERLLASLCCRQATLRQSECDLLADRRENKLMVRVLKHEADFRRQFLAMLRRVETGRDDPSTSWQKKSVHQPEQCALSPPVVTNQANAPLI